MNQTINFSDVFKNGFLSKLTSLSLLDMVIALALAFALGLFIMAVYKKTFSGVMYSRNFGVSLMAMTMITTLIILAVTSNVILSLGMVGALSIVRFRSAVKEPIDIAFLFWAISAGIVLGAGLIPLALIGSFFIGLIMILFVNKTSRDNPYILVVNCVDDRAEQDVMQRVKSSVKKHVIKSKTVSARNGIELTVELRLQDMTTRFINEISQIDGVENAVLVSYNGEYMG
ncbi:DUF4956 domain-containing protein [Sporanaerobium hydrogeniformans]|uniref:DUF4956 domain-containing protein n=1 Tax=Sporanaerobium hydrogeniformans TaxID=3072179 RepID=A0AC61D6D2_9FIRM|nr:DUF4956 domain-containing protein [Sporanaerobium hydrogeniformans]PHV69271.1 DUF4956 domain-containing protein [Sporanaerobium hydrogeniformans]